MPVYVDDMRAPFGRMVMCHMLADTEEELHSMADKIGMQRKWHQKPGTPQSHYDICLAKRALAIGFGAIEITRRQVASVIKNKRLKEVKHSGGCMTANKCSICSKEDYSTSFGGNYKKVMDEKGCCFNCAIFTVIEEQTHPKTIINGCAYDIGSSKTPSRHNGFCGDWFRIQYHTGEIVDTCDLWHRGDIPEAFKERLPDNAVFLQKHKRQLDQ